MRKYWFTITGTDYRYGKDFLEPGMEVRLIKEPDNEVDREAIRVELEGIGIIGYVANSVYTVLGESYSAGRLYDKIPEKIAGIVRYNLDRGVICDVVVADEAEL